MFMELAFYLGNGIGFVICGANRTGVLHLYEHPIWRRTPSFYYIILLCIVRLTIYIYYSLVASPAGDTTC
jgi:ABC-type branched-subunit amino acid transport system permease subunit